MADSVNTIGSRKAMFEPKQDQASKSRSEELNAEKHQRSRDDRVSLDRSTKVEPTYGPIPGVEIGTPYQLLRSLVIKTLQDQGVSLQVDTGGEILDLNMLSPEEAQELVADDGYFGVEKTSQRIVDFAINAFGNDPARLEEMRAAIEDGFQQAAQAFGGQLPEISHQTYSAIMEKLDAFGEQAVS